MRQTQEPIRLTMHALMIGGEAVGSDRELEVAFAGIGRADVGLKLRSRGEEGVQTVEQAVAHLSETPEAMVAAQAMVARASCGQPLRAAYFGDDGEQQNLDVAFRGNSLLLLRPDGSTVAAIAFNSQDIDFSVEGEEIWARATVSPEIARTGSDL